MKPQIGHLEGAAGIAGFIKAILVLRHRHAPRQARFDTPTPRFRWDGARMEVSAGQALPVEGRLVGISAFGISGTNAHALLAPAPATRAEPPSDRMRVLTLSARSPAALRNLAAAYLEPLDHPESNLRDLCYTASVRREHWDHRLAVLGANRAEMAEVLRAFTSGLPTGRWHARQAKPKTKLVFLFPGQGGWRPGVGRALYRDNPIFRSAVDDCIARLVPEVGANVKRAILEDDPALARHDPGQLAHFVLLHSLARTWMRLGVLPDTVIGHSLGEHAAAVIAGVMSLDDGLKAVEARGRLFETLRPPGAMLAVAAGAEWLCETLSLGEDLFIAAINGPEQTVLSGTPTAVAAAEQMLAARGLRVSPVHTYATPGHSPLLAPVLAPFRAALASVRLNAPDIEVISTVTGRAVTDDIASPDYWVSMVERPVLFQAALATVAGDDATFLEIGPGAGLANLAKAATGDWTRSISSLCDGPEGSDETEPDGFAHACARLYCAGHAPRWESLYGRPPAPAEAPTYAFETRHIELPALCRNVVTERATPVGAADAEVPLPAALGSTAIDAVLQIVVETVRPISSVEGNLDTETALVALGFDSLALMEMRAALQKRFGHFLPTGMLAAGASLRGIAAFYANSGMTGATGQDGGAVQAASSPVMETSPMMDTSPVIDTPAAARSPIGRSAVHDLVVTLREGPGVVVALVHPVGGDVLCYGALAAAWPGDAKIVGVRHPEAEQGLPRYRSVPQLAELYRGALIEALGAPPDIVGGWSFGGVVAHEMAWQWEQEGDARAGLVVIDSPFPDGVRASRARAAVAGLDGDEGEDPLGRMIAHPGFGAIFDEQHGLDRLQRLVDAETSNRLLRIHAANAIGLGCHVPHLIRTPIRYALALRADNANSVEEGLDQLAAALAAGPVTAVGFDCDHFSIMRAPVIQGVTGFLGASMPIERAVPMMAA